MTLIEEFALRLGQDAGTPTRRIVTRGGIRTRGIFPSARFSRALHWESDLERRLLARLEASWRLQDACTQPLTVSVPCPGGSRFRLHARRACARREFHARLHRVQTATRPGRPGAIRAPSTRPPPLTFSGHRLPGGHGRRLERPGTQRQLSAHGARAARPLGDERDDSRSRSFANHGACKPGPTARTFGPETRLGRHLARSALCGHAHGSRRPHRADACAAGAL